MTEVQDSVARQSLEQLYALAVAQQRADQIPAAIDTYGRCLALSPDSPEIYNNLGTALDRAGRLEEAVECFRRAHLLDPAYVRPLINLGRVLRLQGRASEALAGLERAIALAPDNPLALTNLGFVLIDLGRRPEAMRHLRRAIALDAGLAEAHHGLGRALAYSGDTAGARDSLQRAITLKPGLLDAYVLLASSLVVLQQLPDALAVLELYLERRPDDQNALATALNCSQSMCDWAGVERALARIRRLPPESAHAQPFTLMGVSDDPGEHLQAARVRAAAIARPRVDLRRPVRSSREKIRVAYLSGDFYTHATSFLIAELLELHDRSAFEVFGVSFGPDDQSPLRRRVLSAFAECLDARDRSDAEIASWLAEREVDIAVDLKGHTASARPGIFAHRPAPVQVSYLGYPGTMAVPFIDYLIADPFVVPVDEQRFYTEKIAYLPDCYQVNDRRRRTAERAPSRAEAGLPESGFVFCCFNGSWKITAAVFDVWMRLLAGVPGSVLWVLQDNPWAVQNLRRAAAARNIAPERLVFAARADNESHLARHRLADLFLDTFPCNAHTTASDALWAGLPLLTCTGRTFASRVAGSLLRAAGLPELIASSLDEYERIALDLARDRERLASLRARLTRDRETLPLFDTPAFCRHLEAAYRRMCRTQREGKPPETFTVQRIAAGLALSTGQAALLRQAVEQHQAGQLEPAIRGYRQVLLEKPHDPDALHMLGVALAQSNRPQEAMPLLLAALERAPGRAPIHFNLGNTLAALKRHAEALAAYRRAVDLGANGWEVHEAASRMALNVEEYADALASADRALAQRPGDAYTLINKASALIGLDRYAEALDCSDRALGLLPEHWGAHLRRGVALAKLHRLAEAESSLERAAQLNPDNPSVHTDLGNVYGARGRLGHAVASFARALELQPDFADARWDMALLKLRQGDLLAGWPLYEERFAMDERRGCGVRFPERRWTGSESLQGKRILIWSERGLGDTLQFCRYAPLIRALGADVTLEVQSRLKALLRTQLPGVRVVSPDELRLDFDYHCPLLSVPGALRTELATIPASIPYLRADPAAVERWSRRLPAGAELRVGIAWQGNPDAEHNWAAGRSWPLAALAPLARQAGVRLISLQTGPAAGQLATVDFADRIVSFGEELDAGPNAFVDTAAILMSLDLVISCDTAVVHLAGALGVPVWVGLHLTSEWRWFLERGDSPWYPTARLFRQRTAGDWGPVVDDMCRALKSVQRRAIPTPTPTPIQADGAGSHYHRGTALYEGGHLELALREFEQAVSAQPDHADAHNDLGATLLARGRVEDARRSLEQALRLDPGHAMAHYNLGLALQRLWRPDDALQHYERAGTLRPDHADAFRARAGLLMELGQPAAAVESYDRALQVEPDNGDCHYHRANALRLSLRFDEALQSYATAYRLRPEQPWLLGNWLHARMQVCSWDGCERDVAELTARVEGGMRATPAFPLLGLVDSERLQRRAAEIWVAAECRVETPLPALPRRPRSGRIRLGYFSADFHDHATAFLAAELFERHDRGRFELTALSFGPDRNDDMRARLRTAFDTFLDVRTRSDREIALLARELELDIAVDLKGHTQQGRPGIFAHRAGPIQVSYLGYPGTSGAPYMDYLIADRALIPSQRRGSYSERIAYLPHSYQPNDRQRRIADIELARADLGLPAGAFVFCSFNGAYKLTPQTFAVWVRILQAVPGSVLWLLAAERTVVMNLRREAAARGLEAHRLIFAPPMVPAAHLARLRAADLFLDTLPCNAHTTASDALWAGLPVLTQAGKSFAARVGASLLGAVGLPELITSSAEEYEALAIELANRPERLMELRERLRAGRLTAPLFDIDSYTRHLEAAYTEMYERHHAGLPPDDIQIEARANRS